MLPDSVFWTRQEPPNHGAQVAPGAPGRRAGECVAVGGATAQKPNPIVSRLAYQNWPAFAHMTKSRWCLLKRPEILTGNQKVKLKDLVCYNLQSVRAYLLKEDLQQLWNYKSTAWAAKFLDQWCRQVMRSRIEPM